MPLNRPLNQTPKPWSGQYIIHFPLIVFLTVTALATADVAVAFDHLSDNHFGTESFLAKLDTNRDGLVSQSEHSAGALQQFEALDRNSDGLVVLRQRLRRDARGKWLSVNSRGGPVGSLQQRILTHLDNNADGVIHRREMLLIANNRFGRIDSNGDGLLSPGEVQEDFFKRVDRHRQALFERADQNGDRMLSPAEFGQMK